MSVLVCTDNGAEALGAIVTEQPDLVLVGDPLAMMSGRTLLAEAALYSPSSLLAAQAPDQDQADALGDAADAVFLRCHPPAVVADSLVQLHLSTIAELSRA